MVEEDYAKIPQIGNVIIENDVEIGANTTIDRAALNSTVIGEGTKIDNLVQIAHNVIIGKKCAISSQSGISGSSEIGNNCILAGQVGIADHVKITDNVILLGKTGVGRDIKKSGIYLGIPSKDSRFSLLLEKHYRNLPDMKMKLEELTEQFEKLKMKLLN